MAYTHSLVNHSDNSQSCASVNSCIRRVQIVLSSKCIMLPCDATWVAIWKDAGGLLQVSQRRHMLAFFLVWHGRAGKWETKLQVTKFWRKLPIRNMCLVCFFQMLTTVCQSQLWALHTHTYTHTSLWQPTLRRCHYWSWTHLSTLLFWVHHSWGNINPKSSGSRLFPGLPIAFSGVPWVHEDT